MQRLGQHKGALKLVHLLRQPPGPSWTRPDPAGRPYSGWRGLGRRDRLRGRQSTTSTMMPAAPAASGGIRVPAWQPVHQAARATDGHGHWR